MSYSIANDPTINQRADKRADILAQLESALRDANRLAQRLCDLDGVGCDNVSLNDYLFLSRGEA